MKVLIWSCGPELRSAAPFIYAEAKRQGKDVQIAGTRQDPESFMRVFKQEKPDFVFCLALRPNLVPYYRAIRRHARLALWYPDQTEKHRDLMWRSAFNNVADVLVFSILDTAQRYQHLAPVTTWMPQYFDHIACMHDGHLPQRLDPQKEQYDVSFIGSCDNIRKAWLRELEQRYRCKFVLDRIGRSGECRGWDMAEIYAQSKIAINIQRAMFVSTGPYVTSNRVYNAMGSGAFFINHLVYQMDLVFKRGIHCDMMDENSLECLLSMLDWWLCMQPDDRERIATVGQRQVLAYHTLEVRIGEYWHLMEQVLLHGLQPVTWEAHKPWLQTIGGTAA